MALLKQLPTSPTVILWLMAIKTSGVVSVRILLLLRWSILSRRNVNTESSTPDMGEILHVWSNLNFVWIKHIRSTLSTLDRVDWTASASMWQKYSIFGLISNLLRVDTSWLKIEIRRFLKTLMILNGWYIDGDECWPEFFKAANIWQILQTKEILLFQE